MTCEPATPSGALSADPAAGPARDPGYLRGMLLVMLAGGFWSLGGILIRHVEAASEWQILFLRSASMVVTLTLFLALRYRGNLVTPFRRIGLPGVGGGMCLGVAFAAFVFAMVHTTIANAVFILSAAPLLTALLALLILRERVRGATWIAMAAALIGIGIMVSGGIAAGVLFGNLMSLCAMIGVSFFAVALRSRQTTDMLPTVIVAGLTGSAFGAVMTVDWAISLQDFLICCAMGVVQISFGMMVFTKGARTVPAAELALLSLTEVILAPIWVWFGFGEVPRMETLLGGAVVLAALAGRALSGLRRRVAPPVL